MKGFWHDAVEFFPILMSGVVLTIVVTISSYKPSTRAVMFSRTGSLNFSRVYGSAYPL